MALTVKPKFMKSLTKKILFAAATLLMCAAGATAEVSREHRAIWMTPFLDSNWPTAAITATNAQTQKNNLANRLDKFKDQNVNIIYYHVRSECDAMYNSAYEPWSKKAAGTRGTAPVFDPFQFLIDESHKRGIEVYAWVNPYRYSQDKANGYSQGSHSLNYEVTNPDWLITGELSRTLNPGLEPVRQRIVDVCKDIITKYDVDGLVMDDYFYPNGGADYSVDANLYAAYKSSGGTLDQTAWRCTNVNDMVRRVMEMIKSVKPYVCFGIAPAGKSTPPNIETEYGMEPSGYGDIQYNTMCSDPLAWLKAGTIDYISPQVYWVQVYDGLTEWWRDAAYKFNRHLYVSTSLDPQYFSVGGAATFVNETLFNRDVCRPNESGIVFFQFAQFIASSERYNGTNLTFANRMKADVWQTKALTPLRLWRNKKTPAMVSNVSLSGTTLTWNAVQGMRYTVYAVPSNITDAEFSCQREYLDGITYTNSYTIPSAKASGYRWAVCVYDRYGNEYSPMFAGATQKSISAATPTAPINGNKPLAMFNFKWNGQGTRYIVELSETSSFSEILGAYETSTNSLSSTDVFPALTAGKTYYWRVISQAPNAPEVTSSVASFTAGANMALISPANGATDVSVTPLIKWEAAESGAKYTLEISTMESFLTKLYTVTVNTNSHQLPDKVLAGYTDYFVRVTAEKDGVSVVSDIHSFRTKEISNVSVPQFAFPTASGATIYSNQTINFKAWSNLKRVCVECSTGAAFPSRGKITYNVENFATSTAQLGLGSAGGWAGGTFSNGKTYYLRARGEYATASGTKYTDYTPVLTFVYNSSTGIDDVTSEKAQVYVTPSDMLMLSGEVSQIEIYAISGQLINATTIAGTSYDLSNLAPGAYVIRVNNGAEVSVVKFVK